MVIRNALFLRGDDRCPPGSDWIVHCSCELLDSKSDQVCVVLCVALGQHYHPVLVSTHTVFDA